MKTSGKNKNAKIQVIGLILVIPLMICLLGIVLPTLPASSMLRDSFWAHKMDTRPEYDIVFVGDSRVYRGIDPTVFENAFEQRMKCLNYGFSSAGLDSFLLGKASRLLNPQGKKILIVAVSANSFLPESLENEHIKSLMKWSRKDVWIKKNIYPHFTCFDPYAISDFYKLSKGEKYIERFHLESGFAASRKIPLDSASALSAYEKQFSHQQFDFEAEKKFVLYLKQLKQKGVKVMVVRVPTSHAMKVLEDTHSGNHLNQLNKKLELTGVKWIEISDNQFISYDGSHLTEQSAHAFSVKLALMFKFALVF